MDNSAKSVVLHKFGGYEVLTIESFPLPELAGKVEIDVHYGALNFSDIYTRLGLFPKQVPFVMGTECCGIITNLGFATHDLDLKVGNRVICFDYEGGLFRKKVIIAPEKCYKIPDDVKMEEAAALFVNYMTAYFSLFSIGNLKPHQNVLIKSCAGGVGSAATQLAKTVPNVIVYGTLSPGKEEFAEQNGVDHIHIHQNAIEKLKVSCPKGFDLILDNQAGKAINETLSLLKPLGRTVLLGANSIIDNDRKINFFSKVKLWIHTLRFSLTSLVVNSRSVGGLHMGLMAAQEQQKVRAALAEVFKLLEADKIEPKIDSIWPMEKIVEATKVLAERKNRGKVLLSMKIPMVKDNN